MKPSEAALCSNELRDFKEPTHDQWSLPLLDNRNGPEATDEARELRRTLRRMRKKARLADQLIQTNKRLREQLRAKPGVSGSGVHHVPNDITRGQAMSLAGIGMPQKDIASFMGLAHPTLIRHYREELEMGRIGANAQVLETFHSVATDKKHFGVVAAGKKWLEANVEGYKPVQRIEHAKDAEGPPIIDSRKLNPEERAQLRALMEKMTSPEVEALPAPDGLAGGVVSEQSFDEDGDDDEDEAA